MSNVAASERKNKEAHPELYCSNKRCLWRIVTSKGSNPCRNHPVAKPESATQSSSTTEGK